MAVSQKRLAFRDSKDVEGSTVDFTGSYLGLHRSCMLVKTHTPKLRQHAVSAVVIKGIKTEALEVEAILQHISGPPKSRKYGYVTW